MTPAELIKSNFALEGIINRQAIKLNETEAALHQCKDALEAVWFTTRLQGAAYDQVRLAMAAANKILDS